MEMRKLLAKDMFTIIEIINDLNLMPTVKELLSGDLRKNIVEQFSNEDGVEGTDANEIGIGLILELVEQLFVKVPQARPRVHEFLAHLCNVKVANIDNLELDDYFQLYADFFVKPELKSLLKFLK
jgi:hypothetical protein